VFLRAGLRAGADGPSALPYRDSLTGRIMGLHTPLYDAHLAAGAKMVDFGGWDMPLHYGSQLGEHHQVRRHAGVFDVSHMTIVDVSGEDALSFLRYLLANDVSRLAADGDALYTPMLNPDGGIVDDLIVYRRPTNHRLIVNSATREKVMQWLQQQSQNFSVTLVHRADLAMLAVQGPEAVAIYGRLLELPGADAAALAALKPFQAMEAGPVMISRTGYTGEDGLEIMVPAADAEQLWQKLLQAGVQPCGLGARDTLRLEAGLNLYGQDMDETTTPQASRLGWTVAWEPADRDFIGRTALEAERKAGAEHKLVGLVLETRGVMRHGQKVQTDAGTGTITSGLFSPTLGFSIALARVPRAAKGACQVEIRGKAQPAKIVRPPFVRHGQAAFK
jgi:aminomethyltransferase